MTQISSDDVQDLARMSGLELSSDQQEHLRRDISATLDYVELLGELDTDGIAPTYHLNDLSNVWRDDTARSSLTSQQLLQLAPDQANHQIKVPKVL